MELESGWNEGKGVWGTYKAKLLVSYIGLDYILLPLKHMEGLFFSVACCNTGDKINATNC